MPVIPLQPMESVYESGYYEDVTPVENITDTNTIPTSPSVEQPSQTNDVSAMTPDNIQYCAVHSCEVTHTKNDVQSENPTLPEQDMVNFPIAAKVCETTSNSSLQEFNPLNDSEPNLEFDMMDQDNAENPNLHVKLMQDARTKKWQVKIRNLTQEQVDFIAGLRLLPTLVKTDTVVIKHHDTTLSEKHDEHEQQPAPANANHDMPNLEKPNGSAESNVQKETTTNIDVNKIQLNEPATPAARPRRPRRSTAKNINYSTMAIIEDPTISDCDEYLPQPTPPPKLNNKKKPSASRITAQRHKKQHTDHDEPEHDKNNSEVQEPQDPEPTADEKSTKGELNIKMVSLPKRVRARTFKCQVCKFVSHSEKKRNTHHKDNHGPLTCVVCNEGFNTPSGLHRHKYRHTDLKFTCETCGERFPFESQLKDHRVKHLTNCGHSCFAKDCGRSFKNKSSLIRHIKVHDGKNYPCPEEGCMYSSNTERNLKAHMIVHTDTHPYSCLHCGQAFKHHTQMVRHVNNKVCHPKEWHFVPKRKKLTSKNPWRTKTLTECVAWRAKTATSWLKSLIHVSRRPNNCAIC